MCNCDGPQHPYDPSWCRPSGGYIPGNESIILVDPGHVIPKGMIPIWIDPRFLR